MVQQVSLLSIKPPPAAVPNPDRESGSQTRQRFPSEQLCLGAPTASKTNFFTISFYSSRCSCEMPLVEDPAYLSKARLKSDLVAHNVELPPAASKKEIYVELHLKHIDQKNAADFSSDDEDQVLDVAVGDAEDAKMPEPCALTDKGLKNLLLKHGVKAGPIVASTRAVYEKKLRKLLQSDRDEEFNEAENAVLYSDSDVEEEGEEENASEGEQEKPAEPFELNQQHNKNVRVQRDDFAYPQCFFLSSRLRPCSHRNNEHSSKRNSKNALKSSERTRAHCSQIPTGIGKVSFIAQHSGFRSEVPSGSQSVVPKGCSSFSSQAFSITQMVEKMESRNSPSACSDKELNYSSKPEHWSRSSRHPQKPVKDILKDIFPDTKTTPTGIYATARRPIKGAAQRPIQYSYPSTPVSPTTLERREVERRLVPIYAQILVFFTVVCVLYLISVIVEDNSTVVALLESLNHWSDSAEGIPVLDQTQDKQSVSGEL
ncbi:lamina-associated polypeptide 2, isoforms beta/gamma-like isoform X2 [Girardinichthys multiradiatus]|uniref:lamina-associated polypeptide 2, isoforms beta/gamma-like isoform X2 n=1 Tax=Girardinichthys multiradiatus TaxID=208333 RepID=UPI001FACAB38|nr:lamina-associated polypeptide 2, isoforms beta/gamma-like isoform X2 [Girardinichthys multiradiatus]